MAGMSKLRGKLDTQAGEYGEMLGLARGEVEQQRERKRGPPEDAKKPAEVGGKKFSINGNFKKEIDDWNGTDRSVFTLGTTSEALQSIGVKDRTVKWTSDAMAHAMKHKGMTLEIIKQVPEILENPIIVMQSRTVPDRITMFGEVMDKNGAPVIAVLEINPKDKDGRITDINILNNAYGKDRGIENFMKNSKYLYIDPQKNRTNTWLQRLGLQLPLDETKYGSIGRISYTDGEVNIHAVPWEEIFGKESAAGRKLSAASMEDLKVQNDALKEQVKALNAEKYKLAAKLKNKTERENYFRDRATFSPEKVGKGSITKVMTVSY